MLNLEELNEFAYIGKVVINNEEHEVHNDSDGWADYFLLDGREIHTYNWDRFLVNVVRADMIYRNYEAVPTVAVECTPINNFY